MRRLTAKIQPHKFRAWLPLFVAISILCGMAYGIVLQIERGGANDILFEMAHEATDDLTNGGSLDNVATTKSVNIASELRPYTMIFNDNLDYIKGTAVLDNQAPIVPIGVLEYARTHKQNTVTWAPKDGVRQAIVVFHYSGSGGGYVLAGRNLQQIEKHISNAALIILAGWLFASGASLFFEIFWNEEVKLSSEPA